jgi:hypothetical protein
MSDSARGFAYIYGGVVVVVVGGGGGGGGVDGKRDSEARLVYKGIEELQ